MSTVNHALSLAARGFWVFPCRVNDKRPVHKGWQEEATREPEQIKDLWGSRPYNVGISTSRFGDDRALVVVDVDTKHGKRGDETLLLLEIEGHMFPSTCEHLTPSGGKHLLYVHDVPVKQGTDVLGSGLDIRSKGGYIVAPGSTIDGRAYAQINGHGAIAQAPDWLVSKCGIASAKRDRDVKPLPGVDPARAVARAVAFLKETDGVAQGARGSQAYKVAARLKDFGCDEPTTVMLMDLHWAWKCEPPIPPEDMEASIAHAYRYGQQVQGSAAPEAVFPPADPPEPDAKGHPFEEINKQYAFIKHGACVLQETTNEDGIFTIEYLSVSDFHSWFANKPWSRSQEKARPISMHWMEWAGRRQYDGVVFAPQQDIEARWYNLWRGFSVAPADKANHPALDAFLEHAFINVCNKDQNLFRWLMGYFAHMIQRPWEKPLVALVMKGKKGTGKNALLERVGALLGTHFLVADDDRYLLGNFNSHLESNLFFVLDEAAWAGDKKAEGKLKGLITGQKRLIEHKGKEPRNRKNLSRVAIIGNEDWLVPASQDERRFAVFSIGEGRMQDRDFFRDMREGMEAGGYAHLLRYLLDYDLTDIDVNDAPKTQALIEQKHASLDIVQQWWLDCLTSGGIAGGDWGGEWPEICPTNRLRDALARWAKGRNIRSRLPEEVGFGRLMKSMAPGYHKKKARPDKPQDTSYSFFNPGLDRLRSDWHRYIGGVVEWPE